MKKITVLGGAGAMGQVIVRDLVETADLDAIVIADFDLEKANKLKDQLADNKTSTAHADIRNLSQLVPILQGCNVVINSTPYYFNINVMEAALEAGCHYLDLGGLFHVTQKQLQLHEKFIKKNLVAILGIGAAPGITNVMAAAGAKDLDTVSDIHIAIGCVDFTQVNHPFVPPYALDTILDEYTKASMVYEDGKLAAKPPMSGEIAIAFPEPVGMVKAILTLHSEIATLPDSFRAKGLKQATFRLGLPVDFHEKLKFLVDLGMASTEAISTAEGKITPRKVLAKLVESFQMPSVEPNDCEVIRTDITGTRGRCEEKIRLETIVRPHERWKISSGALDTGVPPSIVAQMIVNGEIKANGVMAPELCVPQDLFFQELSRRSIVISQKSISLVESAAIPRD
jgi:lysine 6-dehydrogenase